MSGYQLDPEAFTDLNDILIYIEVREGEDAAFTLEAQFVDAFERLAGMPGLGHRRPDLTSRAHSSTSCIRTSSSMPAEMIR